MRGRSLDDRMRASKEKLETPRGPKGRIAALRRVETLLEYSGVALRRVRRPRLEGGAGRLAVKGSRRRVRETDSKGTLKDSLREEGKSRALVRSELGEVEIYSIQNVYPTLLIESKAPCLLPRNLGSYLKPTQPIIYRKTSRKPARHTATTRWRIPVAVA